MSLNTTTIALSWQDGLTVRSISERYADLMSELSNKSEVVVEISDNQSIDLSLVQLIESARIFASTSGKKLTLAKPASGQLRDVLERGGFLYNISPEDSNFWLHDGVK